MFSATLAVKKSGIWRNLATEIYKFYIYSEYNKMLLMELIKFFDISLLILNIFKNALNILLRLIEGFFDNF